MSIRSIRELLPLLMEEIKVDYPEDSIVIISPSGGKKSQWGVVERNGGLWVKSREGVGEPKIKGEFTPGGDGDTFEEYDKYRDCYKPLFNSLTFTREEMERAKKMNNKQQFEYAQSNSDKLLKIGKRKDGSIVKWARDHAKEELYNEQFEKLKNLHIVKNEVRGNLGTSIYYSLSCRISKRAWNTLKEYFYYVDASEYHDEIWWGKFKGWAIKHGKVEELEELLEIPQNLRLKALMEKEKLAEEERKKKQEYKDSIKKDIETLFNRKNSIEIPSEIKKKWYSNPISLEGKRIENPFYPKSICGGGQWFVLQEDCIWRVYNNGGDGDDWSFNFIRTGGAGAYGFKFERTKERMDLIKKFKDIN
ncbi:MAG: hypothetical protein MJA82_12465 [Clostridia bacterium]|nr:hypothetical protein [Clostridia bacterium]